MSKKDGIIVNPLLAALKENDKKNLFSTNVTTAFLKTGFPLFDYYFGSVINIHDEGGKIVEQKPRIGQCIGTFNLIIGSSGSGKALPDSTRIPTPNGFKLLEELKIGDTIYDENGNETMVNGIFPQGDKFIWKIIFSNGKKSYCSGDHLWTCYHGHGNINDYESIVVDDPFDTTMPYRSLYKEYINHIYTEKPQVYDTEKMSIILERKQMLFVKNNKCIKSSDYINNDLFDTGRKLIDEKMMPHECGHLERLIFLNEDNRASLLYGMMSGLVDTNPINIVIIDNKLFGLEYDFIENRNYLEDTFVSIIRSLGLNYDKYINKRDDTKFKILISGKASDIMKYFKKYLMNYKITNINVSSIDTKEKLQTLTPLYDINLINQLPMEDDHRHEYSQILKIEKLNKIVPMRCIKVSNESGLFLIDEFVVTHNTTLAIQLASNIARQYDNANIIHYDCEQRMDISRIENISKYSAKEFDSGKYILKSGLVGLDTIQEMIVKLYAGKMKLKNEIILKTDFKDEFGRSIDMLPPTIIIIDSITSVFNETFSWDNNKELSDIEKLQSNTDGARSAKTLKGFFKDILPLCKEANIIIYAVNHINSNMSMNSFIPVSKQQNFLKQDESIPGGKTMIYYPFNIIKLIAKPSDDFTEEGDGFNGHMVMVEPVKSSTNQSGNDSKGVSFKLVFSFKSGFDSLRSLVLYGKELGLIEGNKNKMKFKDDSSFTFSFKNIDTEVNEKPIWDNIKKFIIPTLNDNLPFIEPTDITFDNRNLDY